MRACVHPRACLCVSFRVGLFILSTWFAGPSTKHFQLILMFCFLYSIHLFIQSVCVWILNLISSKHKILISNGNHQQSFQYTAPKRFLTAASHKIRRGPRPPLDFLVSVAPIKWRPGHFLGPFSEQGLSISSHRSVRVKLDFMTFNYLLATIDTVGLISFCPGTILLKNMGGVHIRGHSLISPLYGPPVL